MDPEDNNDEGVFDDATLIEYITALRQYFRRETRDGGVEYLVGGPVMQLFLQASEQGLRTTEAFLVERGLIDLTPRGRVLTELGISRAEELIAAGKGIVFVEPEGS